jgi:hypothetical protein
VIGRTGLHSNVQRVVRLQRPVYESAGPAAAFQPFDLCEIEKISSLRMAAGLRIGVR